MFATKKMFSSNFFKNAQKLIFSIKIHQNQQEFSIFEIFSSKTIKSSNDDGAIEDQSRNNRGKVEEI